MFKLYDWNTMTILDMSPNEQDIIDTIGELVSKNKEVRLKIIYYNQETDTDEYYRKVNDIKDYYKYLKDFLNRKKDEIDSFYITGKRI